MRINLFISGTSWFLTGSPKSVKILDYQTLTPGHPAFDIWAMVYSATDAEYRANHLEEDLKAYYAVLSGYMDEKVDYKLFREEVEERRVKGMTMDGEYLEENIARGTTDPEIDSVTWIKFINNIAPLALVAYLATRWRHLH